MFAIFLHENMNPFYQTITSFPTLLYTGLLLFCLMYWIVAMLGLVEVDFLDFDLDGEIEAGEGAEAQHALAGLLLKLGLHGVPLTIILTIIAMIGWLICYYASLFSQSVLPGGLIKYLVGLVVLLVATYVAALLTAQIIKPMRRMFSKLEVDETKHVLGQTVVVRSARVDRDRGEAFLNDGGAGLILHIRATGSDQFVKGDEVVLIEKLEAQNVYRVVAKSEFSG